ncbi:hypothetical protein DPEC_G00325290 [Dallia pectoralis]|uniref:Uncharacterized protein n=1 Tax=Dallia pectoralis TaxID=75939 RepID=A0ACC2FB81_DALPE|nr:hypothetical protein DPEC_G00325290 [Dallia pectoralis]
MDDITIVGTDSRSITTATKVVDDYCAATGALVNRGKSELFLSGHWHETLTTSFLKAIVLPILLYLGRVFPPDKAKSKKIERLMFTFVWGSQMERLQCSTLYKMARMGGRGSQTSSTLLGHSNSPTWSKLSINRTEKPVSLRDTTPHPSSEHWEWALLTTQCPIAGFPQKSTKPSETLPSGLSTAGLASWKYKDIMGHIRSKDTVAPLRTSSTVAPQQVWLNVNHHCLTNRQKDISWMAVHGCLATGEFMYRRHIALTVSCPHGCKTAENTYHVLAECSVARRVWALFVPSVSHKRLLTLPGLTTENILNGRCSASGLFRSSGCPSSPLQVQ